jgi:predicted ArsR family transcriptional regulator
VTEGRPGEADWLHAVGNPARSRIMRVLLEAGTATPTRIAALLGIPYATVNYHVGFLRRRDIIRLAGRTKNRGASVYHFQLVDRERVASVLWGARATLLVTDFERQTGRADATVRLDADALAELRALTAAYLARIGELGLQTRERRRPDRVDDADLTTVAVLFATDDGGEQVTPAWQ